MATKKDRYRKKQNDKWRYQNEENEIFNTKYDKRDRHKSNQEIEEIRREYNNNNKFTLQTDFIETIDDMIEPEFNSNNDEKINKTNQTDNQSTVKPIRTKTPKYKTSANSPQEPEENYEDGQVDDFVKNFKKLAVTDFVELCKVIFPKYFKGTHTDISNDDVLKIVQKIAKTNGTFGTKAYIEDLAAIKRLKYFFDTLNIDEIFIGKEGFYGSIAFTMKDNDLTMVENFLAKDNGGNTIDSYGYATYLISKNHMFELLTKRRSDVQKISKDKRI